jgi:hypothetical protein
MWEFEWRKQTCVAEVWCKALPFQNYYMGVRCRYYKMQSVEMKILRSFKGCTITDTIKKVLKYEEN